MCQLITQFVCVMCAFVTTNVFDANEIRRNCQFLPKERALMEQLSHSQPFVPVFCFSFIPILKHMSFCSARNIDFNILFTLAEQAIRNLNGPKHVLYFYTENEIVCMCVCTHASNSNRALKRKKKSPLFVSHLLGSFQNLLLMLATWHCLIRFVLPLQSASNQLQDYL